ncbi:MAG TPA: hypothetical protein ACFYEF_09475 [Candidatus Wunengus sp. YC63]|uniref:hypothetical protein n=2 Tax=unclassified Candidatus Wunengus TaxID=3367695 RepID=UPI004025C9D1
MKSMRNFNKKIASLGLILGLAGMALCANSPITASTAEATKESAYQEFKKEGRLYVFASPARKADFEKSGELGSGIIKIGHGPNGETVVFDSEEAVIEYESRLVKEILGKVDIKAYREFKIDGRLYVFTSPARKAEFEKTGEMGKSIIKIGYGSNNETVVFDSDEAVVEYDKRHLKK